MPRLIIVDDEPSTLSVLTTLLKAEGYEVTSALDWESDRLVVEALDARRDAGGTTLIITHRLHLAAAADRVVVLDDCVVVQQGRHDDLVHDEGLYGRLWALQTGGRPAAEEK